MFSLLQRKRQRTRAEKVRDALVTRPAKLAVRGTRAARKAAASAGSSTRQTAAQAGGSVRQRTVSSVLPRLTAARETTQQRVSKDVAPKVAAGVAAARAGVRDRLASSQPPSDEPVAIVTGRQAEKVADQVGRGSVVLTDVDELPEDLQDELRSGGRRGRLLLLLALAGGAAYAYRRYSAKSRADSSWDIAAAPSSQTSTTTAEHRIDLTSDTGDESAEVGRTVIAPASGTSSLGTSSSGTSSSGTSSPAGTGQDTTSSAADEPDLPGDPTKVDVTAASRVPASLRSDEGPGISDTDDAARRTAAGEAGGDAFRQAAGTDDSRS